MLRTNPLILFRILLTVIVVFVGGVSGRGADWVKNAFHAIKSPAGAAIHHGKPASAADPAVERLAAEIDWLEHHLDRYGTIVAKQPNVWGEARLTQHRDEFERVMAPELQKFEATLNGALRRSDQSYLSMALALQAAANPQGTTPATAIPTPDTTTTVGNMISTSDAVLSSGRTAPLTKGLAYPYLPTSNANNKLSLEPTTFLDQMSRFLNHLHEIRRVNEGDDTADSPGYALNLVRIPISVLPGKETRKGYGAEITITAEPYLGDELLPVTFRNLVINDVVDQLALPMMRFINLPTAVSKKPAGSLLDAFSSLAARTQSPARTRRAQLPLPPTQVLEVYGEHFAKVVAEQLRMALRPNTANRDIVHLPDVESYLRTELVAAYELLSQPDGANEGRLVEPRGNPATWSCCNAQLVDVIRRREKTKILAARNQFLETLAQNSQNKELKVKKAVKEDVDFPSGQTAAALAWAIIVESALLTDRLVQDMRESAAAKGLPIPPEGVVEFFGPQPSAEAREVFKQYVRGRWPIHVFALDPMTQDQNIGDEFSRRRELQLALALAFASGNVNAQTMSSFSRRLEWDMATIALNRTIIAFSHGTDTFGWRFYPRFQTPPIKGSLATFGETLFGGPTRDQDTRQRELEPGMRADLYSYGPTRANVRGWKDRAKKFN